MRKLPVSMTPTQLFWTMGLFILFTGNLEFFRQTTAVYQITENWPFLLALAIVVLSAIVFFAAVFSFFLPVRLVASLFLIIAAVTGYFSDGMSIVVDTEMVRNVFRTDTQEVGDLVNWSLIGRLFLLGVVPVIAVFAIRMKPASLLKRQLSMAAAAGVSLLVILISVVPFGGAFASYAREHKPLRYYTNPTYPIYSILKLAIDSARANVDRTYVERVESADVHPDDKSRELIVVVIGESARADHFGVNGYERQTTPKLAARPNVVSFSAVQSCGTSTASSLPCIFSLDGREDFNLGTAEFTENTLDVLNRAGVSILWRDNNSGSQGVANRLPYESFSDPRMNPVCDDEGCRDIGMLEGLGEYVAAQDGDILIVMHQIGSHGPAYYKRYPEEFAVFEPDCQTKELADCSKQEIENAYDNTILYTDYFLDSVIAFLADRQDKYETAMLYLSDHGESLGEMGVYLHGMPYAFAPEAQTNVPFIVWAGEGADFDLSRFRDEPMTHDDFSRILLETFEIVADGKAVERSETRLPMKSRE